ncbi:acylphosphatase [Lacticaseibacillus thailandensis]|uniref:acylphosphatase n=1 Tax=Lacticaseibacillus thailandensis TaxID=381741 RepID=UPI003F6F8C44
MPRRGDYPPTLVGPVLKWTYQRTGRACFPARKGGRSIGRYSIYNQGERPCSGVGFRATTQMVAMRMQIRGDVRNQSDGSVLIHAVGSPTQMKLFAKPLSRALHSSPAYPLMKKRR